MTNNYSSAHNQQFDEADILWELLLYRLGPDLLAKADENGDGDEFKLCLLE